MAQLLILAFDTFGSDETRDKMAWKCGHVVDVKPDGHIWGTQERLPKFWKIKLPGIAVDKVVKFLESKLDWTEPTNPVEVGIRKYRFDINDIPVRVKNALIETGEIEITKQTVIDGYMKLV